MSDAKGELFIKPCTAAEIGFYEATVADHPEFAEYMPAYLGTLALEQDVSPKTMTDRAQALIAEHTAPATASGPAANLPAKNTKITTDRAVVLEDTTNGFIRPNILDVKLGVRLYADYANEEKKIRFDKLTRETTHQDLGFRIGGMRIWQGKQARAAGDVNDEGYRTFDKFYGRSTVNKDNVVESFRAFLSCQEAGMDDELSSIVARAFLNDVEEIQRILEAEESRMYSASLLFVFEGDGRALRRAIDEASRHTVKAPADMDAGDAQGDNDEAEDEEDEIKLPKIYAVKVIDFAHASWTPGQGADENQLKGIRSVAKILHQITDSC